MNILIVGLGYAGGRFLHAFESLRHEGTCDIGTIGYVGRNTQNNGLPFFRSVAEGLAATKPDIVVLSVNDVYRMSILEEMSAFDGFVICEKPFLCPWDNTERAVSNLAKTSGFCLDLVERYSPITISLKEFVEANALCLMRANFTWGKNRLGDHRPTCGVTSEIIHPLDIVQFICGGALCYRVSAAHGTCSDFSVSGPAVVDSVAVIARLGDAPVLGYASFVNVARRREVGLIFARPAGSLVFAHLCFDDPRWDDDELRVWEMGATEDVLLLELRTRSRPSACGALGLQKTERLVSDVVASVRGYPPKQPFPDINQAVLLQRLLNEIHAQIDTSCPVLFSAKMQVPTTSLSGNLERLG